jgi:hypothetical protein
MALRILPVWPLRPSGAFWAAAAHRDAWLHISEERHMDDQKQSDPRQRDQSEESAVPDSSSGAAAQPSAVKSGKKTPRRLVPLVLEQPPKPVAEMSDEEPDAYADSFADRLALALSEKLGRESGEVEQVVAVIPRNHPRCAGGGGF